MTTLLSARKRAEEFDALLNGGATDSADLAGLAKVAFHLREHAPVSPRAEFSADLRELLMAEAATVLTAEAKTLALPVRQRGPRERKLVAAATAVVFFGGTAGMAAAAQNALPGDALYPIKRTIESAQAGLTFDDAAKGRDLLGNAGARLSEAEGLLSEDASSPEVAGTINDFSAQALEGATLLAKSFQEDRDPASIEAVRSFAADSLTTLQELAKVAPPEAQEALTSAAIRLQELDQQMLGLCSTCSSDLPPLAVEEFLLSSSGLQQAIENAAKASNSRVRENGTKKQTQSTESPSTGSSTTETPSGPAVETPEAVKEADKTVKGTTEGVKKSVKDTVAPLEELLDDVIPGVGGLVGDLTDGVSDGLLGN